MQIIIEPSGKVRCIYNELVDLPKLGVLSMKRGSHVEPNERGEWFADLSPVNGPKLGPFSRRSEALQAEIDWLENHWLPAIR